MVRKNFVRIKAPAGVGIDDVRKHDIFEKPDRKEGRGRLYLFAIFIAGIFGTIAMRLWSLQLIAGESYIKLA